MQIQGPTTLQPEVTVVEIDDPAMAGAGVELLDLDAVQLTSMPLRARQVVVQLEACTVVHFATNARVRTRTSVREDRLAYVAFGPRTRGTVNGLPVFPGLMLAAEPGAEARFIADPGYESITFLLKAQDIREHLIARDQEEDFRLPSGVEVLQTDDRRVRALYDCGRRLVDIAAQEPTTFDRGRKERGAAQVELIETLLAALSGACDFAPRRSDRTLQSHSLIVKVAEDHALARVGNPLYVTDLCRAAGVSERTLEYAFNQVLGLSPVTYLIRLRLHRVRRALLAATQGSTTVSAEALKWGFWHFGEFSRAYRECFGELPSDSLRRAPGELRQEADFGSSAMPNQAPHRPFTPKPGIERRPNRSCSSGRTTRATSGKSPPIAPQIEPTSQGVKKRTSPD